MLKDKLVSFLRVTLFLGLMFSFLIPVYPAAQFKPAECEVQKKTVKWWQFVSPGEFLPIIPEGCGQQGGQVVALSPALLPDIGLRLYGFVVSLMFYLITPVVIFAGLQWTWGGIFGEGEIQKAKELMRNSVLGLVTIVGFYMGLFIILSLLGANEAILNTDIKDFFTF